MPSRKIRQVSEREIAINLVMQFAEWNCIKFSMLGFYDDDYEFVEGLADRLDVTFDKSFVAKMTKVVRRLENYGVLVGSMSSNHKEYIGEPAKQKSYWLQPGKVRLIQKGQTEYTMTPLGETKFLLRHAYPDPKND